MRLLKKFKEYNYYDDEVVYSKLYIFLKKIGRALSSAFDFICEKGKAIFKFIADGIKNRGKMPRSEKQKRSRASSGKAARFFARAAENEALLKITAFMIFIVFFVSLVFGFAHGVQKNAENEMRFKKDAGAVCTKIISKYGTTKTEKITDENGAALNLYRLTGLAFIRVIDFNNDNSPELLVCYEDGGVYYAEIWGYSKKEFVQYHSFVANSDKDDETLGSWLTLYHLGSKYYIGILSGEENEMALFGLSGKQFKQREKCLYDSKNDLYYVDGERATEDFETIRLSYLMPIRAQKTAEAVAEHLCELDTLDIEEIENTKTDEEKAADAYYEIVQKYNQKYGRAEVMTDGDLNYISGLAAVRRLDFNNDGAKELMLVYRYGKKVASEDKKGEMLIEENPTYYMEIYSWNAGGAKLIYENDGLSCFQYGSDAVFYILRQENDIISVCNNSYVYDENTTRVWKATSRISSMNEDGRFEPVFTAEIKCNYDYMKYWIDGERVYKKAEFEKSGYQVPYFCSNDEFDSSLFTVNFLQSEATGTAAELQKQVDLTVAEIKTLNENYSA